MSIRRVGVALAAAVFVTLVAGPIGAAASAAPGPSGGACQLHGQASLKPGLTSSSQNFTYSFTGALSNCQSNVTGAPGGGNVAAGQTLPETVTLRNNTTGATTTGTVTYQAPIPTGTGSCGNSTTTGTALVTWANGKHTVIGYTTSGVAAAVALQGTVVANVTLTLVASSVPAGWTAPATFVIGTDEPSYPAGRDVVAPLAFSPSTQDQNCVTVPVSTANIDGLVAVGSAG